MYRKADHAWTSKFTKHAATLDRIEDRFGVDRYSLVAIWGIESQYGQIRGDFSILSALATLAFCGRRQDF